MDKRKPFSIVKWLIFPSLSLALAAVIVWFNITVFGWQDGAAYMGVVAAITLFSILINKYVKLIDDDDPTNDRLAVTAFVFEIILTLALIINAAYSLSVQREMSVARQVESAQGQSLESVSKFRDRRAQREAARMLREQGRGSKSSQAIFAQYERPLFWIMVGEMLAYGIAAFTLLAVSSLTGRKSNAPSGSDLRQNRPESDFPDELDVDYELPRKNAAMRQERGNSGHFETVATVAREDSMKILRDHLRSISHYMPGRWFKADLIKGGVKIRLCERQSGREETIAETRQSNKILAAVNRPDFRERLIRELIACGFPIGKGER